MAVKSHNAWHRVVRCVGTDISAGTLSVIVHRCRYVIQILLLLSISIIVQQDTTVYSFYCIFCRQLYMFRLIPSPITVPVSTPPSQRSVADTVRPMLDVITVWMRSWWRTRVSSETCRAVCRKYNTNCIQGDSGGICTTLGNDSMSDSKQKSSYEHGSDFERLRSYDRLKLGKEGNDYWQRTEENNKPA